MGLQIIQQPDGRYAVWSSVVDDFVVIDASVDQVIEFYVSRAAEEERRYVRNVVKALAEGTRLYHPRTMTWGEACKRRDSARRLSDAQK